MRTISSTSNIKNRTEDTSSDYYAYEDDEDYDTNRTKSMISFPTHDS